MPLGGKTGEKLEAQTDIINTLGMPIVKIFSQLLLYLLWMTDPFHFQLYIMLCISVEIDSYIPLNLGRKKIPNTSCN